MNTQVMGKPSARADRRCPLRAAVLFAYAGLAVGPAAAGEWSGNIGTEWLGFAKDGLSDDQERSYLSASFEPEFYTEWDGGHRWFMFETFLRGSQHDSRRSHVDIRELHFGYAGEHWEVVAGISKVFWGITESQHLVDIVNQTDLVENIDTEDKLGQPMLNITHVGDAGTLDLFLLPYFRERTFPGKAGRLRGELVIDQDNEIYESSDEQWHFDWAARWYLYTGDWEIALSHFRGTSRTPFLQPTPTGATTPPVLTPLYRQIRQSGLEILGAFGAWLLKFEGIHNQGFDEHRYLAANTGFEYTLTLDAGIDLGAVVEYSWDDRGRDATTQYQNDLLLGTRLTFNDVQSTQILAGVILDLGGAGHAFNIEAERRIGESWKATLEARGVFHTSPGDFLYGFRRDNHIRMGLARYF
jgi:hypothetical protein